MRRGASLLLQRCGAPAAAAERLMPLLMGGGGRRAAGAPAMAAAAAALPLLLPVPPSLPHPAETHPRLRLFSAAAAAAAPPSPKTSAAAQPSTPASAPAPGPLGGAATAATKPATPAPNSAAQAAVDEDAVRLEGRALFESCWRRFIESHASHLRVPREVVWLNGAPGAGKSANIPHLLSTRGLSRHVSMSTLLEHCDEAKRRMDHGELLPDALVVDRLLEAILVDQPGEADDAGFVVDGFPRTPLQCEFLKLLYEKLCDLHDAYGDSPRAVQFPRPSFKIVVLWCDEATSVARQVMRARVASVHNRRVADAGGGRAPLVERATDQDIDKARRRYRVFKQHYGAMNRLKAILPFSIIDAMGTLAETREQISNELRYQSSHDLQPGTYRLLQHIPLARDVAQNARSELVARLDSYSIGSARPLFKHVLDLIAGDVMPIVMRSGLAGRADYITRNRLFTNHPLAVNMVLDVLSDRGFHVSHRIEETAVPVAVVFSSAPPSGWTAEGQAGLLGGLAPAASAEGASSASASSASTAAASEWRGDIELAPVSVHHFRIMFDARGVRDDFKPAGEATAPGATASAIAMAAQQQAEQQEREEREQREQREATAGGGNGSLG